MNRLKKMFLTLAVVAAPVLFTASAMAQGVAFNVTALSRQVRFEGRTETLGELVLSAPAAPGTAKAGSSITVIYGATITGIATLGNGSVTCSIGGGALGACPGTMTVLAPTLGSTNQFSISFNADTAFGGAGVTTIDISQVRADVSVVGAGTTVVNATLSGVSSQPSTFPLTFAPATVQVASVQNPSTKVSSLVGAGTMLTCNAVAVTSSGLTTQGVASFKLTENFSAALTSNADETGFTPGYAVAPTGTTVVVTVKGLPTGWSVTPSVGAAAPAGATLTFSVPGPVKSTGADIALSFKVLTSNTALAENAVFTFTFGVAKGDASILGGAGATVTFDVGLNPIDTSTTPATTISFAANSQGTGTLATVNDCRTYLLYPWVVNTGDGAYDTGMTVSNTTADGPQVGTKAQSGAVNLYFFPQTGSTAPGPIAMTPPASTGNPSPKAGDPLPAGQTATFVASSGLGAPFQGYVIAVCNFQLGHGVEFIVNPRPGAGGSFAQGYTALSVTNPRLAALQVTESAGQ